MATSNISTRLLIISDTHGHALLDPAKDGPEAQRYGFRRPLPKADIALHCGDLTLRSTPEELKTTLELMREIDAPLKLVIPGNHDSSLDLKFWEDECRRKEQSLSPSHLASLRRHPQECTAILQQTHLVQNNGNNGITHVLTRQGTYHFILPSNGAQFTIFTSPWTPAHGRWGFQYERDGLTPAHLREYFPVALGTHGPGRGDGGDHGPDVMMTHGPPFGVLDYTRSGVQAGCRYLLETVVRARPKVHCFGHIHEGAGAALVRWGEGEEEDEQDEIGFRAGHQQQQQQKKKKTEVVATVAGGSQLDERDGSIRPINLCGGGGGGGGGDGSTGCEAGKHTLFVNAAIMTIRYQPLQSPWLVDLDLALADERHRVKAEETRRLLASLQSETLP